MLTGEIRLPCLMLSAKTESVSVYCGPIAQNTLPFSVLLILLATKALLTRLLCRGQLAPEIAHITQIIMAALILWASSTQWPLLALRTKRAVYLPCTQAPGLRPVICRRIYYPRGQRWFALEEIFYLATIWNVLVVFL